MASYKQGERVQLLDDGYDPLPGVTGVILEGPFEEPQVGWVYKVTVNNAIRNWPQSKLAMVKASAGK